MISAGAKFGNRTLRSIGPSTNNRPAKPNGFSMSSRIGERLVRVAPSRPCVWSIFHPSDRPPLKNHLERWNGIMGDMQDFYRSEMERLGYGKVTLTLEKEEGKLKMHQVRGKSKDDGSYTYKSGGKSVKRSLPRSRKKASIPTWRPF